MVLDETRVRKKAAGVGDCQEQGWQQKFLSEPGFHFLGSKPIIGTHFIASWK